MEKKLIKKAIVETVGPYMYIDTHTGFVIEDNRPCVAQVTPFLSQKIADGLITLITPNLPKEADDKEFCKTLEESKGDKALAIAAFVSQFGLDESGTQVGEYTPPAPEKTEEEKEAEAKAAAEEAAKAAEAANKETVFSGLFKGKK